MNETGQLDTLSLPSGETAPGTAVGLLHSAVQGAHGTLDRLADSAAPAVRQLGESVSAAEEALHARTAQLREKRDAWVEGVRSTVRDKPLASVLAALVAGVVITRVVRIMR